MNVDTTSVRYKSILYEEVPAKIRIQWIGTFHIHPKLNGWYTDTDYTHLYICNSQGKWYRGTLYESKRIDSISGEELDRLNEELQRAKSEERISAAFEERLKKFFRS